MNNKICSCCGLSKPVAAFQVRKASKDGRTASCGHCLSKRDKARDTPERAAQRKSYQHGVGKVYANKAKRNYIKRNPIKRSATIAVGNAIRDGKLIKKCCEVCGNVESFAHHDDYNKPLLVRWLCDFHHKEWHKSNEPIC